MHGGGGGVEGVGGERGVKRERAHAEGKKRKERKTARARCAAPTVSLPSLPAPLSLSPAPPLTWEISLMTSRLSRLARNQEDWANRKSPARTATRVPYSELTVVWPGRGEEERRGAEVFERGPGARAGGRAKKKKKRTAGRRIRSPPSFSPLRVSQSSRTSSCTREAVWIISVISARRRCLSLMSLQGEGSGAGERGGVKKGW